MTKIDLSKFNPNPKSFEGSYIGEDKEAKFFYRKIEYMTAFIKTELNENEFISIETTINNKPVYVKYFGYFSPNVIIVDGIDSEKNQIIAMVSHTNIEISYKVIEIDKDKSDEDNKFIGFVVN